MDGLNLVIKLLIAAAILVFLLIIGIAALWLKGGFSIALPLLGIIVSSGIVLCFFTVVEIIIIAIIVCLIYW
ncbi:MAG: hypothetical protein M3T96_08845 [Acidobacteriota bacterium]|nr:hypothetical protein [Acidobacteriota bacterium]